MVDVAISKFSRRLRRFSGAVMKRVRKAKRLIRPDSDPLEDPHSYVTAPKRPLVPVLSAAAAAERPED